MYCPKCRSLSLSGDNCQACGQPLPLFEAPPVPSKAAQLRQSTLEVRTGDITMADFLARLEQQEGICYDILGAVEDDVFDAETRLEMDEELTTGRRGVTAYLQALESLRAWSSSRSDEDLKRGLALAEQADLFMQKAIELNFATERTHLETTREFLQQMGYSN